MPFFKVGVSEKVYYEEIIIEADNEEQAKDFYREIEAQGLVDTVDTDGLQFDYVDAVDDPPAYVDVYTKEDCLKLCDEI